MGNTIAIPSEHPGGMEATLGAHFGHCDCYTIVSVADEQVADVKVIPNVAHQHGSCMAPVKHLADNDVNQLVSGGMGMRPLMGFKQMGIDVFFSNGARTVGEAVHALLGNQLQSFGQENTCSGCGDHEATE